MSIADVPIPDSGTDRAMALRAYAKGRSAGKDNLTRCAIGNQQDDSMKNVVQSALNHYFMVSNLKTMRVLHGLFAMHEKPALAVKRRRIETLFSQLTDQFKLELNYAKTFLGFKTRVMSKLAAISLLQLVNALNP